MAKSNVKAETPSNEQLMQLILSLKAENEALKAEKPKVGISLSDKGGINVTLPAGKGSVTMHFYAWHWAKISEMKNEIDAFAKKNADKLISEATFRANKAK
jgi:hypothetical protein